jgi:hypothetical protein
VRPAAGSERGPVVVAVGVAAAGGCCRRCGAGPSTVGGGDASLLLFEHCL